MNRGTRSASGHATLLLTAAMACLVAGLAAAPAASSAGGSNSGGALKTKRVSRSVVLSSAGQIRSVTARCPKGSTALGGGFLAAKPAFLPLGPPDAILPFASRRVGRRGWRVSGLAFISNPKRLTAYAYCGQIPGPLKVAAARTKVTGQSGALASVDATCPRGTRPLSGGFATSTPSVNRIGITFESRRIGRRSWRDSMGIATPDSEGAGVTMVIRSYAYCAPLASKSQRRRTAVVAGDGTIKSLRTRRCPKSSAPVGGGFAGSTPNPLLEDASFVPVFGSQRVGRAWRVTGVQAGSGSSSLTAYAYC